MTPSRAVCVQRTVAPKQTPMPDWMVREEVALAQRDLQDWKADFLAPSARTFSHDPRSTLQHERTRNPEFFRPRPGPQPEMPAQTQSRKITAPDLHPDLLRVEAAEPRPGPQPQMPARTQSRKITAADLRTHLRVEEDMPVVPEEEFHQLHKKYTNNDDGLIKLAYFQSKTAKGRCGRGMFVFRKGWQNLKHLKEDCPNLYAQLLVEQKYQESFVLMWSNGKAIGLHTDNRALDKATMKILAALGIDLNDYREFDHYNVKCIQGGGPKQGYYITGRNLAGAPTNFFFHPTDQPVRNSNLVQSTGLGHTLLGPENALLNIERQPGMMTFASTQLQGGGMSYEEGKGCKVVDWKADPARKAILHGANVEKGGFSFAILGTMAEENVELYMKELKGLPRHPPPTYTELMPKGYFAPSTKPRYFEVLLSECKHANNADGTGGMPPEVHKVRSVGGDPANLPQLGLMYTDAEALSGLKAVSATQHGEHTSKGRRKKEAEKKEAIEDTLAKYPGHGWTNKSMGTNKNKRTRHYHAHFAPIGNQGGAWLSGISTRALQELLASPAWKDHVTQKQKQLTPWATVKPTLVD